MNKNSNLLGLDIGGKRIGVARINTIAQISEPLAVLENDSSFLIKLNELIKQHMIDGIVVGVPRNMSGEKTQQSKAIEDFTSENLHIINLPIYFQDETLSTVAAAERSTLHKNMEDAVAACVILEDFMREKGLGNV